MSSRKSIIVHGGAGRGPTGPTGERQGVLDRAAAEGLRGRSAVDMVERAIRILEDHPIFDAGTGAVLTLDGGCELDACLMTHDGRVGAVAGLRRTRYPISVARAVMEKTDHHLLVGAGATRFARLMGHPDHDPRTPERLTAWRRLRDDLRRGRDGPDFRFWKRMARWQKAYGLFETVGACAIDERGRFVAATSTGGIWMKLPGRVGDTPIPGAGTCANPFGAISMTGHGEGVMRHCLGRHAVELMRRMSCQAALDATAKHALAHGVECGIIGVDRRGRLGRANTAKWMQVGKAGA
ncbi:MAG: isoaspartyl peptidase/L-asparaginase [Planctomycetia bacterium]|nr:isoaspartyl peptidase/L-asparaginase [Planctomycetia bacterium]